MHLDNMVNKSSGKVSIIIRAVTVIFLAFTIIFAIRFFRVPSPPWALKWPLMISVAGLFISISILYLQGIAKWQKKNRNILKSLYLMDRRVLYEKYNRVFVNDEIVRALGYDPSSVKKLTQKDKRDIMNGYY